MKYKFSKFVKKYSYGNGCILFHLVNQEIIIGAKNLEDIFIENRDSLLEKKNFDDVLLFDFFVKNKFLILESDKDIVYDNVEQVQNTPKNSYTLLRVLLTDLCNLQCKYCKVEKNIKNITSKSTPSNDLREVVKIFLKESKEFIPKVVHITGGEPLIFWNDVKKIVDYVGRYKRPKERIIIVIGTNSILLDENKIKFIKDNNIKVIVSLDGKKEHHDKLRVFGNKMGSYDLVDKGIRRLKKEGVEVGISMVVGKHNVDDLDEIISYFISEYKPASLGVNFMKTPAENEKDFDYMISPHKYVESIYSVFKKYRDLGLFMELPYRRLKPVVNKEFRYFDCGAAAGTTINIDAKGNIGPCKSFLIMEEVYSNKIKKNQIGQALRVFRDRAPINKDDCNLCPALAICGNGCAYSSYIDTGDYMSIDKSACSYSKHFHKLILQDLFDLNKIKINKGKMYYIIEKKDRGKLLGEIHIDQMTLSASIGHET